MPGSVRVILPRRFQKEAVLKALEQGVREYGPTLKKEFDKTVKNWTGDKPTFTPVTSVSSTEIKLQIRLTGNKKGRNKWIWLDKGTRPHKIKPRKAKMLAFPSGHRAGSKPGSLYTTRAQSFGETVYSKGVKHPGTEARGWTDLIIRARQKDFAIQMRNAMQHAAKVSGHGKK